MAVAKEIRSKITSVQKNKVSTFKDQKLELPAGCQDKFVKWCCIYKVVSRLPELILLSLSSYLPVMDKNTK